MARQLAIPMPFSLDGFRACLEQHCRRVVLLVPAAMDAGGPSGTWIQGAGADYLYYESQTSPFHQAHIVLHLAARMLFAAGEGTTVDPRLVPDVSPHLVSLMLGDGGARGPVAPLEAETFAFLVLEQAGGTLSGSAVRQSLRQLQQLRAAVLDAVPEAAYATASVVPLAARFRLHQTVVEIRDATLALSPYRDPRVVKAATIAADAAGLAGDDAAAAVEAAVLAGALRAVKGGEPTNPRPGNTGLGPVIGMDLRSETGWLLKVSRELARFPLDVGLGRNDPWPDTQEGSGSPSDTGHSALRERERGWPC